MFASLTIPDGRSPDSFGIVRDVSEVGLCISAPVPPPIAIRCVVRISVEERMFELTCFVARITPGDDGTYRVGLEFAPKQADRLPFLEAFLKSRVPT